EILCDCDVLERLSIRSPTALELQCIHVEYENASAQVVVGDKELPFALQKLAALDPADDHRRISRILACFDLPGRFGHALNSRQQYAFFGVLAHGIGANPDVARLIRENQMKAV